CYLSNGRNLLILAEMNVNGPFVSLVEQQEDLRLVTEPGLISLKSTSNCWTWDRDAIAKAIAGRQISRGFYSRENLYLYFDHNSMIQFVSVIIPTTNTPFLNWNFAD